MEPLDVGLVQRRLKEAVPALDEVYGAAEYSEIKDLASFRIGTAYVVLASERNPAGAGPQPRHGVAAEATFGVIVPARNYRDPSGAQALGDLRPLLGCVRQAVVGWAPPGWKPCIWLQGDAMDSDASRVLWIDVFTTTHVLRGKS